MDTRNICCVVIFLSLLSLFQAAPGFPADFLFGSATASYQVEGAWNISRGLSIWDVFSHTPGKTHNGDNGDVADDEYHRYAEDIELMRGIGLKNYRLSISWTRLFPTGRPPLNPVGVAYYNNVIDLLLKNGIEPFVTLYHWDLPQDLHTEFLGWLSPNIVPLFTTFADAAFSAYGDRVKKWITFNEPLSFTNLGYGTGQHAPGRCSDRTRCQFGDSSTEPYLAAHHVLLAHASSVTLYRQRYQQTQKGIIGITLNCDWSEPLTASAEDAAAAERHMEWQLSWYADPVFKGDYPLSMRTLIGNRLPTFTAEQQRLLKGSWDYFGFNHYTSNYVFFDNSTGTPDWGRDQKAGSTPYRDGKLIGPRADSDWLFVVPWGIYRNLRWIADRYDNPPIYITENGVSVPNETELPLSEALHDQFRVDFYSQYIGNVSLAIRDGVNVKSYFAWSFLDNFEWADGYNVRFGIHYVDYNDGLKRYAKDSAKWFQNFINS